MWFDAWDHSVIPLVSVDIRVTAAFEGPDIVYSLKGNISRTARSPEYTDLMPYWTWSAFQATATVTTRGIAPYHADTQ
ncbi:hypothetical protein DFI02_11617 [Rhizobium sp. PP-F2F-G20b]|nr:hypothetical protein DFI02_11617 [Rhizobium sp. PP-F2F-G20b]